MTTEVGERSLAAEIVDPGWILRELQPGDPAARHEWQEAAAPVARTLTPRRALAAAQPYLYLLPAFLSVMIWIYLPILGSVELAFYEWNLLPTSPRVPVGFENFERLLTLPELAQALGNTGIYIFGLLPLSVVVPLAIALAVADLGGRSRGIYRAIIFVPVLMAPVVVAILWRWILSPGHGVLNSLLTAGFGIPAFDPFRNAAFAIWAIVFITAWKIIGFSVLIFSAGLTGVSREYLEAAGVDGASKLQSIRHITLPLLTPTIMFMVLLTVLLSAQWAFPLINVLTQGGPRDATTNVYYLLWQFGFKTFNVGLASAAAILFLFAFGALALVFTKLQERYSFHDA